MNRHTLEMTIDSANKSGLKTELRALLESGIRPSSEQVASFGAALHAEGECEAALRAFDVAAELAPDHGGLWNAVATLRYSLGLTRGALAAAAKALAVQPNDADALFNTGVLFESLGDADAALHCYSRTLEVCPAHRGALLNRAPLLARAGRIEEAVVAAEDALRHHPEDADYYFNLGDILLGASHFPEALDAFDRAAELDPSSAKAEFSAGVTLAALSRLSDARARMKRALHVSPNLMTSYRSPLRSDTVSAYRELTPERIAAFANYDRVRACDWGNYDAFGAQFGAMIRGDAGPPLDSPDLPYVSLGLPVNDELRRRLARNVASRIVAAAPSVRFVRPKRRDRRRLRIGYISGDLRVHAVSHLLGGLFGIHDRSRFEVYVYSTGPDDESRERKRAIEGADKFRDVSRFAAAVVGQAIAMDGVDVLVDLSGYTLYGRPDALVLRPAPVQVSYLGFMGTQGAPWIDYAILDRLILSEATRQWWDEKVVYLPGFYAPAELPPEQSGRIERREVGLDEEAFVLCAMHMPRKVDPASFRLWLRVLEAIPSAQLWLVADSLLVKANLMAVAESFGIPSGRLVFADIVDRQRHLARQQLADLFLDSISYNGHTSTTDALAVGLPVLTMKGVSVVARVSEAMLKICGLPMLAASDGDEFVAIAKRLANDCEYLQSIRETLFKARTSCLFDLAARVRELECAYEMMWARQSAGLPPQDFDVPRISC